jgi:glycosyltransferase involved in cell wall biosynthesis
MTSNAGRAACDVVIPARNAERYIAAAIDSVLAQRHAASRIIIVNDQSADHTVEAAAAFGSRVQIIDGAGRGSGSARNLGVRHAVSEMVAFLDADDVCHPDRLGRQVNALVEHPDATMAFCDAEYVDASGQPTGSVFTCPDYLRDAFLGQLFERNRLLTTSVAMVRRSAFDAVGGFDERLSPSEEYDLWLRLAGAGRVEHNAEPLVSYRLHDSNISSNRDALRLCERDTLNKYAIQDIHAAFVIAHDTLEQANLALSGVLFRMERYDEGETLARGVTPADSDRALRHFLLGNFAVKRGDVDGAGAEYDACLRRDPTYAPARNNLGVIAAAQGRRRPAFEHFTRAQALRPGYSDPVWNLEALHEQRDLDLRYTLAPLRAVLRPE